jgi:hypothetical protein
MNDLDQLREDVRATAPQPRPHFAARLERNVEAGFKPAKPPKEPRRLNLWAPGLALACTALVAVVVGLASLDTGGDDEAETASGGGAATNLAAPADEATLKRRAPSTLDGNQVAGSSPELRSFATSDPRVRDGRRVVEQRTALELETGADAFTETTDEVLQVADESGSIVQSSRVSERDGKGFARFDLRVPAARLDATLADLSRLAHVTSRTAQTEDFTRTYVSAGARLEDARGERRALLKALERADTDEEAESLRQQIRLVRSRIAYAENELNRLRRRADRAKVSVTVRSTGRKSEGGAWTPGDAIDDAGRILEVAAGVVVVTAAALLPVAILAALAGLAARSLRRRRRDAALDTA